MTGFSFRMCKQADRYRGSCDVMIKTLSDNPIGYDALCDLCKEAQMYDDLKYLKSQLQKAEEVIENRMIFDLMGFNPHIETKEDLILIIENNDKIARSYFKNKENK